MKVSTTLKNTVRDVAWKAAVWGELKEKEVFSAFLKVKFCHTVLKKTQ